MVLFSLCLLQQNKVCVCALYDCGCIVTGAMASHINNAHCMPRGLTGTLYLGERDVVWPLLTVILCMQCVYFHIAIVLCVFLFFFLSYSGTGSAMSNVYMMTVSLCDTHLLCWHLQFSYSIKWSVFTSFTET